MREFIFSAPRVEALAAQRSAPSKAWFTIFTQLHCPLQ